MTQPQPSTVALDDASSDALAHLSTTLDQVQETLKRIARAVEGLTSSD